jgi:hypothetical protein
MRMRTVGVMLVVVALALAGLGLATAAFADPGLSNIPAHRHYVQTSNGRLVQVGPRLCDNANQQNAFNQFHNNLHVVSATGIGPAAPGLHNLRGAELVFGPC